MGATFADWGIPTAECIVSTRAAAPDVPLIASGGLQNGLDAAKALALGADIAGLARPFLQAAAESESAAGVLAEVLIAEIATVMFCTGCGNLDELKHSGVLERLR